MQQDSRQGMGPADEEWTILGQQEQSAGDVREEILCDMLIVYKERGKLALQQLLKAAAIK